MEKNQAGQTKQAKPVIVQAGPYAGEEAVLLGTDYDYLGYSIFGDRTEMGQDYMKRLSLEPVSTLSKVFIAHVGNKTVALNEYEISGKQEGKK